MAIGVIAVCSDSDHRGDSALYTDDRGQYFGRASIDLPDLTGAHSGGCFVLFASIYRGMKHRQCHQRQIPPQVIQTPPGFTLFSDCEWDILVWSDRVVLWTIACYHSSHNTAHLSRRKSNRRQ